MRKMMTRGDLFSGLRHVRYGIFAETAYHVAPPIEAPFDGSLRCFLFHRITTGTIHTDRLETYAACVLALRRFEVVGGEDRMVVPRLFRGKERVRNEETRPQSFLHDQDACLEDLVKDQQPHPSCLNQKRWASAYAPVRTTGTH